MDTKKKAAFGLTSAQTGSADPISPPSLLVLEHWMGVALEQAEQAFAQDEVPVGAVIIQWQGSNWKQIASDYNRVRQFKDPTAHAESLAMRKACEEQSSERLSQSWLICTLEPCVMCLGTAVLARVAGIAYGASEPKTGACGSAFDLASDPAHLHRPQIVRSVRAQESSQLLQAFFKTKRSLSK